MSEEKEQKEKKTILNFLVRDEIRKSLDRTTSRDELIKKKEKEENDERDND